MAIILPPAPLPLRNAKWRDNVPAQLNRSSWTGRSKIVGLPGAAYVSVTAEFVTQIGEDRARPWRAFFKQIARRWNSFRVPLGEAIQTAAANPSVRAGATAGTTLPLQGLPASAAVLRTGDFMTVRLPSGHERPVCLVAPLNSNGSGQGTAVFDTELGEVPATGIAVEIGRPWGLMRLTSDVPGWDVDPGQLYSFSIAAEEAL